MNHEIRKHIAYCYPSSINAEKLGKAGWYVEQERMLENGEWSLPYIAHNCDVFDDKHDPDLLALFNEYEGRPRITTFI